MVVENIKYQTTIVGFHGTLYKFATKILTGNFKKGRFRDNHWLGQGVYFFRDDYEQAKSWAMPKMNKAKENGAVLMTKLKVNSDNFLNLDSRKGLQEFKEFKDSYVQFCIDEKLEITAEEDILRCAVCDALPEEVKVIQRTFKGNSKFNDSLEDVSLFLHGQQICVRDTGIIDEKKTSLIGVVYYEEKITKPKKKKPKIEFS